MGSFRSRRKTLHPDELQLPPLGSRKEAPSSPKGQIIAEVFNMFDQDGSGEIELNEIARAFKTTGKMTQETREQLKAHFAFMDSDGSGEVTLDEFRAALGHGDIAFRNYQHQQVYHSLGLTLCQNLAVYRRHMLHREFEHLARSNGSRLAEQFQCLVKAVLMSTFALNLSPFEEREEGQGSDGDEAARKRKQDELELKVPGPPTIRNV